jgi:hypothetical protein
LNDIDPISFGEVHETFLEVTRLFSQFQGYFVNFLDEQSFSAVKPNNKNQEGIKTVNDGLGKASNNIKNLLEDLATILA